MNNSLSRITAVAGLLVSGLLGCTAPAASDSHGEVEAAIKRWYAAVNAQDVGALTSMMTGEVVLLGDTTVTGRDAAIQALRQLAARGPLVANSQEITIDRDIAWHVARLAQSEKNGDVHELGQALEIWKRVNGEWQLHRRMAAGAIRPEVSLTRPSTREPVLDRPRD